MGRGAINMMDAGKVMFRKKTCKGSKGTNKENSTILGEEMWQ